jgi:hypothetical protein
MSRLLDGPSRQELILVSIYISISGIERHLKSAARIPALVAQRDPVASPRIECEEKKAKINGEVIIVNKGRIIFRKRIESMVMYNQGGRQQDTNDLRDFRLQYLDQMHQSLVVMMGYSS